MRETMRLKINLYVVHSTFVASQFAKQLQIDQNEMRINEVFFVLRAAVRNFHFVPARTSRRIIIVIIIYFHKGLWWSRRQRSMDASPVLLVCSTI